MSISGINVASCDLQPNGLLMTKYQRGRLKKLKKRASTSGSYSTDSDQSAHVERKRKKNNYCPATRNSLSGLKSWEDIAELEHLLQLESREKAMAASGDEPSIQDFYGPSIHLFKSSSEQNRLRQKCSGTDHRDLMLSLLFHDGSSSPREHTTQKQRKVLQEEDNSGNNTDHDVNINLDNCRGNSVSADCEQLQAWVANRLPPLPSWARIHNPAYATHLAVIEISLDFVDGTGVFQEGGSDLTNKGSRLASFIESNSVCKALCSPSGLQMRQALLLHTKLFEGDNPKRASAILGHVDRDRFLSPITNPSMKDLGNSSSSKKLELPKDTTSSGSEEEEEAHGFLYKRLEALMLTPQQMMSEGYPTPSSKFLDFISKSSSHDATLDLNKISDVLQNLMDSSTSNPEPDTPIINSPAAFPFTAEYAKELVSMFESYMLNDQPSPVVKPLYLSTFITRKSNALPRIFAIDCEMVKTTFGLELVRVTLIRLDQQKSNETATCHYTTVLDMLVKPPNKIIDFVTEYSGISAQSLDGVSTSIEEVQVALLGLISKEDIIVGHSLENDLHALRLFHLCVVDTAVLFRTGGRKQALRHLSLVLLKRSIQNTTMGHCSIEDAVATLELAFRRAKYGSGFKLHYKARREMHLMELIDTVRKRHDGNQGFAITREKGGLVCIGSNNWIKSCVSTRCSAHTLICEDISCSTRNSVCAWMKSDRRKPNFLLASICVKQNHHITLIDDFLDEIVQAVPRTTMVLVIFQYGYENAFMLTEQRKASNNPKATLRWDDEKEIKWRSAMEECRNCEALWIGLK